MVDLTSGLWAKFLVSRFLMKVIETQVEGVKLIEPNVFGDQRGFSWKHSKKPIQRAARH